MRETLRTALVALRTTLATLLVTGIMYPLAMTGFSQILIPNKARGSLVADEKGAVVGSALIGQRFSGAAYFQPRPSAAGERGYDAAASSGSNLGPTSSQLRERVQREIVRLHRENPKSRDKIPVELVTTSASGLDPHLSPAAVDWQVPRVAHARGIVLERVQAVVKDHIEGRDLGFLGEPRVNVLLLNLSLDQHFGRPGSGR